MTFIQADDWSGVYVDGELITEGHRVDPVDAVKLAIKHKVTAVESKWCDLKWMHEQGNLPAALSDVKLDPA